MSHCGARKPPVPEAILEVKNLKVHFPTVDGIVKAVDDVSFTLSRGETLGVVGESGSGKSVGFLTIMGLINRRSAHVEGEIIFKGRNLLEVSDEEMRKIRGDQMGMVFQDPMTSLHPMYKVGDQIVEGVRAHRDVDKKEGMELAIEMLKARRHPKARSTGPSVPARIFRRDAAKGDDRHGPRIEPRCPNRR